MGIKDEIKAARYVAARLQAEGDTLLKIAETLNLSYHGFYYVLDGRIYRENVPETGYSAAIL